MVLEKTSGANGEMTLSYRWEEASNTGREDEYHWLLRAAPDGRSVDLVVITEIRRVLLGSNDRSESKYRISVPKLVDLIKKNGKPI